MPTFARQNVRSQQSATPNPAANASRTSPLASIELARASAPPIVREVVRSSGQALDPVTRAYMESRFGHDFSKVRVHSDPRAAESAQAMGSLAYTVGDSVMFGQNRYRPDTVEGRHLLAHELAHVVQQQGTSAHGILHKKASTDAGAVTRVGSAQTPAEREADHAALAVAAGKPARVIQRVSAGTVQRSVLGSVAGTLFGAGFGALAGSIFGPVGAAVGAIIGGLAGLIEGASSSADARKLTSEERTEAKRVYGPSLNYDRVRVAVSRVMTFPSHARTPHETIYFPPDTIPDPADMSDDLVRESYYGILIHELCHVWQTQHGIGVTRKLFSAIRGKYEYGGGKGLREAWAKGTHFLDFGLEQQGEICEDYYARLRDGKNTSAYRPYIMELQQGGRRIAPGLVPASEPGDFPTPSHEEPIA